MVTELTAAQHQEAQRIHAQEEKDNAKEELDSITAWLNDKPLMAEHDVIRLAADDLNITFTEARKALEKYPKEYIIQEHDIPSIIKQMRLHRRTLKGNDRTEMTKAIECKRKFEKFKSYTLIFINLKIIKHNSTKLFYP